MASQWTLIWLLLLSVTIVVFAIDVHNMNIDEYLSYVNPPAVHKFRNEHGDSILCVLYADQISLRGSEQRSVETRNEQKAQNFSIKTGCPEDTVPILETKREDVERKGSVTRFINSDRRIMTQSAKNLNAEKRSSDNTVHQFAHVAIDAGGAISQVSAQLNVWKPKVDTNGSGIFSSSQISAHNYDGDGFVNETVTAGWEVYPSRYGDTNPRFFVNWFADVNGTVSGCLNTLCPGFVLASGSPNYLGGPISPVSTYNASQQTIDVKLAMENAGSNDTRWSLYLNNDLLGWWPGSLFQHLRYNAAQVGLGGQVMFYLGTPSSKTEMGSGHLPSEGFRRSAVVSDIKILNADGVMAHFDTVRIAPKPNCYNVSDVTDGNDGNGLGTHFFFGGPGGDDADCAI